MSPKPTTPPSSQADSAPLVERTPHKPSHTYSVDHDPIGKPTKVEVKDEVRANLRGRVFKDTKDLVGKICHGVDVNTDMILDAAVAGGFFSFDAAGRQTGNWTCLPSDPVDEKVLYDPFKNVANPVTNEITNHPTIHGSRNDLDMRWESNSTRCPLPTEADSAEMKLDVAGLSSRSAGRPVHPSAIRAKTPANPIHQWHEIIAIVEMKKKMVNHEPALKQLLEYFFQLFGETIDRRGLWGLVFSRGHLTLWLADRSGVLGSKPINIHVNPHLFVKILAAFAVLPRHRLGIDTHIKLFREPTYVKPQPSSDSRGRPPGYVPSTGLWKVEIDGEAFILWKPVSLQRAHTVCGRATRVWHAWLEDEFLTKWSAERQQFIVKDSWRDSRRTDEGFFYDKIHERDADGNIVRCDGVALFRRSCIAKEGGVDDTTDTFRCGAEKRGAAVSLDARQDAVAPPSPRDRDPKIMTTYKNYVDNLPHDVYSPDRPVRPRTHSWIVLKTYGWPMRNAVSPLELATVLRDAIAGHKTCWAKKVLHRDISPGNILIEHVEDEDTKTMTYRGALIDFDNAKYMENTKCLYDDELSFTYPYCSAEVLSNTRYFSGFGNPRPGNLVIHDLESFMWCLVWMCIYRGGPTSRRELITSPRSMVDKEMRGVYENLFDGTEKTMIITKRLYIQDEEEFRRSVLSAVDEYWATLRPLCEEFYRIIRGEYKSGAAWTATIGDTSVHDRIIAIFDDAIRSLPPDSDRDSNDKKFRIGELDLRKRDWHDILDVPDDETSVRTKRTRDVGDDNPAPKRAKVDTAEEAQQVASDESGGSGF